MAQSMTSSIQPSRAPALISCEDHQQLRYDQNPIDPIPVIDLSQLVSGSPDERSRAIRDLGMACEKWGFFLMINHGVSERLMNAMALMTQGFFDLPEEEKRKYESKQLKDPIRYGKNFDGKGGEAVNFSREFVKVLMVRPQFHCPCRPEGFSDVLAEYCDKMHEISKELLKGISESLGLDPMYINRKMDMESSQLVWAGNRYPPCPEPESAMAIPPHTDYGFLTFLVQHGPDGLEISHNGRWVPVHPMEGAIMVNTCDHMEIMTNGKYKSVPHRARAITKTTRISIVSSIGPSPDTFVGPAEELLEHGNQQPKYMGMKYNEYFELVYKLFGKSCLESVKLSSC